MNVTSFTYLIDFNTSMWDFIKLDFICSQPVEVIILENIPTNVNCLSRQTQMFDTHSKSVVKVAFYDNDIMTCTETNNRRLTIESLVKLTDWD